MYQPKDTTHFLSCAGKVWKVEGESAEKLLKQDLYFTPKTSTPEKIKKYRNSTKQVPGVKQVHYGIFDDSKEHEKLVHGVKVQESEHVNNCMQIDQLKGINYYVNEIKEKNYVRNIKEPLGKKMDRKYEFPNECQNNNFMFGKKVEGYVDMKEVVHNGEHIRETQQTKDLYNKTHGLTDPGQQKDRKYNWPAAINKNEQIFGKQFPKEEEGAKKSLQNDFLETNYPKTIIAKKNFEDYRQANLDMLGKSKFRGTLNMDLPENHSFGLRTIGAENWNVAKCLHGEAKDKTSKHIMPDKDLGIEERYNQPKLKTSLPPNHDPNRAFGTPSIRKDVKWEENKQKSLLNPNNYGYEKDAYELLYPNQHAIRPIEKELVNDLFSKEQIQGFLKKNNYVIVEQEFNTIFKIALENYPNREGKITVANFMAAIKQLKNSFTQYNCVFNGP